MRPAADTVSAADGAKPVQTQRRGLTRRAPCKADGYAPTIGQRAPAATAAAGGSAPRTRPGRASTGCTARAAATTRRKCSAGRSPTPGRAAAVARRKPRPIDPGCVCPDLFEHADEREWAPLITPDNYP